MATQNYGTVPSRNTSVSVPAPRKKGLLEQPEPKKPSRKGEKK